MPMSDAERRAQAKYRKDKVTQLVVRFYPSDGNLRDRIKEAGGTPWLKRLAKEQLSREAEISEGDNKGAAMLSLREG